MIKKVKKLDKESREFRPVVLKTKEELLTALQGGYIKTSKYSLLNEQEKMFVDLFVFADHSAEEAMRRVINFYYPDPPESFKPKALAYKMMTNPVVQDVLDELTVARDKKFMMELVQNRDLSMKKIMYIMATTEDEALAVAAAKTILDKAEAIMKLNKPKEEPVGEFKLEINLAGVPYGEPVKEVKREVVEIEIDAEDSESVDVIHKQKKQRQVADALKGEGSGFVFDFETENEEEEDQD
jgi:hypothetical protein